jgi:ABC-type lipopolysaccharide export system ATPase subunit/predicted RNA methylase
MPDWTREYFERGYAQRWGLLAPSDRVRLEAAGLWTLLQLSPTSRVIDIGCGHGRHALVLAERASEVIGLDFTDALLNRARHLAVELRTEVRWIRGDMRRLPFRSGCADAAMVMDAFGFFDTEEEHDAVLREVARVLTIGGRLALKVVNGGLVLDDFRETEREERDGVTVLVSNTLAIDPPRLTQRLSVSGSRGHGEYERRQRLYRVDELRAALDDVSVSIGRGELFGFIGPDGGGKTTLFRILVTLLVPESGTARVLGRDVVKDLWDLRRRIGYMPGRFSLYPDLSVEENIRFFASVFGTTLEREYEQIAPIYTQLEPFKTRRSAALSGGIRLKPSVVKRVVALGVNVNLNQHDITDFLEVVPPPAQEIQFKYSIFDEGSGREFQSEPILSTAGLGISNGERPFRHFAVPIYFVPRSTIRMQVTEVSEFPGTLHVSLQGYKELGGPGTPTGRVQRQLRRGARR